MCTTPRPKRKKVLGAIAGDIAAMLALADIMSGIPSNVSIFLSNCCDCNTVALKEYYDYIHRFLLTQKGLDIFEK